MKTKKLLSLLTAAAISISSFAAFAVTASAEVTTNDLKNTTDTFYEWTFVSNDTFDSNNLYNWITSNSHDESAISPVLSVTEKDNKAISAGDFTSENDVTVTGFGSEVKIDTQKTRAFKHSGGVTIKLQTNLKTSGYDSYDLIVAYYARNNANNGEGKEPDPDGEFKVNGTTDEVNAFPEIKCTVYKGTTTAFSENLKGLTAENIEISRSKGEIRPVYIGIKYNKASTPAEPTIDESVTDEPVVNAENGGNPAKPYVATFTITNGSTEVRGITWTIPKLDSDTSVTKDLDLDQPVTITANGSSSIAFGLVVTGTMDQINQIGTVTGKLKTGELE